MKKATIIIAIVALAFVLIVIIGKWYVKKPMTNSSQPYKKVYDWMFCPYNGISYAVPCSKELTKDEYIVYLKKKLEQELLL